MCSHTRNTRRSHPERCPAGFMLCCGRYVLNSFSSTAEGLCLLVRVLKLNSVASVRQRTIPSERPPLVGEVSAKFCGYRVPRGQRDVSPLPYSRFSVPEPLLFHSSSSLIVLTRLSGPRSRPTTSQKIWERRESNSGPLDL
jgi:hypothetical protein